MGLVKCAFLGCAGPRNVCRQGPAVFTFTGNQTSCAAALVVEQGALSPVTGTFSAGEPPGLLVHVQAVQTIVAMNYSSRTQRLLIYWSLGSVLDTGPKGEAFFERLCEHKAALLTYPY